MLRASAACEELGLPTSSLTCEGFIRQAGATSIGLGMPSIPLAMVPGHIGTKSAEQLKRDVLETTAQHVIENLTVQPAPKGKTNEPAFVTHTAAMVT